MIDYTLINEIVQELAPQLFVDQVSRNAHFLKFIEKKSPSSAQGPRWQAKVVGHSGASSFSEGSAAPAASDFQSEPAKLPWGQYHATVNLGGLSRDILEAANATYIADYLTKQLEGGMKDIADEVNTDAFSGTASPSVIGLTSAIDDAGTYADINRSTYANWQTYINDNSGTPRAISTALMASTHDYFINTVLGDYDQIWTSQSQVDALAALTSGVGVITPQLHVANGQTEAIAVLGFGGMEMMRPSLFYRGRPVFAIPGYPSGRVDFIKKDTIWFEVLKDVMVEKLAKVNDDENFYITYKLQLVVSEPRMGCASLQDLS